MTTITQIELRGRDGIRLAADTAGDPGNPPIVLLHGGGQTRHSWGTALRGLAERGWYVTSVDLRGHGDSEWAADGDYRLEAFAEDIRAVASTLDRPVLVGASLGGTSSLAAIGQSPGDPIARALVLVDVTPYIEADGAKRIGEFMRAKLHEGFGSLEEVADAVHAYNPHRPRPDNLEGLRKNVRLRDDGRWRWHWDPAFVDGRMGSSDETRLQESVHRMGMLEDAARSLTIPTLLVRGRMSDLLSEEGARRFLELVPSARLVDVAGAGHMVAGDRNDVFNDAISEFVESVRG